MERSWDLFSEYQQSTQCEKHQEDQNEEKQVGQWRRRIKRPIVVPQTPRSKCIPLKNEFKQNPQVIKN